MEKCPPHEWREVPEDPRQRYFKNIPDKSWLYCPVCGVSWP